MTETERNQIKGALLKCAKENENRSTLTGHIVISSLCKSAVERVEELEKENTELKDQLGDKIMQKQKDKADLVWKLKTANEQKAAQLTKAKVIMREMLSILPKENIEGVYEITEEAEHFISEVGND